MSRFTPSIKWLYPGMRVKRWLTLALGGVCLLLLGAALFNHGHSFDVLAPANRFWAWSEHRWHVAAQGGPLWTWSGAAMMVAGIAIIGFSVTRLAQSITSAITPTGSGGSLVDAIHRNRVLAQGPRIVVIGGGTGLSTMLRGLKQYTSNITAIVTVTDDGGSSGKLTQQYRMPPPGDIRNCLVALADAEATMTDLFQFRFRGNGTAAGLRDHAFGNLLIAALTEISQGDFEEAVRKTSRVLNIRGTVLPSTLQHVRLRAEMADGSVLEGETSITSSPHRIRLVSLVPADTASPEEVLAAMELADLIVVGPGSVYTSIIPNLLVRGIPEALRRSRARKVFICNVMTQPGETDGFAASDHVKAIEAHVDRFAVQYVMINTGIPSLEMLNKYRQSGAILVEPDADKIRRMGYRPIAGSFISQTDVVRHDPGLLAEALMRLLV